LAEAVKPEPFGPVSENKEDELRLAATDGLPVPGEFEFVPADLPGALI